MIMTREEMLKELHEGICVVVFEKIDGTERTMKCTLMEDNIPGEKKAKDKTAADFSQEVIRVYDIENEGWRSFKIDKVKSFF